MTHYKVETETLYNIYNAYSIEFCYYLKIDTEGHDVIILDQYYKDIINNCNKKYLPHKILFESNVLTDGNKVNDIIKKYNSIGYDLITKAGDTIMKLNLNKLKYKKEFIKLNGYTTNEKKNFFDTLEQAKHNCILNNYNCISSENNKYMVCNGKYLEKTNDNIISWIFL